MFEDFVTITASHGCSFQRSLKGTCKYCVDGSICHFKFLKIVLAHILGEVGALFNKEWNEHVKVFISGHTYQLLLKSVHI